MLFISITTGQVFKFRAIGHRTELVSVGQELISANLAQVC
jgi:hypothetical protein